MDRRWKNTFQMWSATKEYKNKVKEAKEIIKQCFKQFKNPYVAYSGGKDSIAMLHLVLQTKPNIDVWLWDHGPFLMPRGMQHEIEVNGRKIGAKNLIVETSSQLNDESVSL